MALINYAKREINAKIVYYGPGLCGKTTNIKFIHQKLRPESKGKLLSLATETDRTLFFDFLPVDLGEIKGYQTRFHLYTVPGQVFYNSTRKMVLKGADGIVFVADSQRDMLDANLQSLANLRENLLELGKDLDDLPMVIQCNKRDLPNALSMEDLDRRLNPRKLPIFAATAQDGTGVLQTLSSISKMVLYRMRDSVGHAEPANDRQQGASYRAMRQSEAPVGNSSPLQTAPAPPPVSAPRPAVPPPSPAAPVVPPLPQPALKPPVPPPPALPFVVTGSRPARVVDLGRIVVPVEVRLHGVPVTIEVQLRLGVDSSNALRGLIEKLERKEF